MHLSAWNGTWYVHSLLYGRTRIWFGRIRAALSKTRFARQAGAASTAGKRSRGGGRALVAAGEWLHSIHSTGSGALASFGVEKHIQAQACHEGRLYKLVVAPHSAATVGQACDTVTNGYGRFDLGTHGKGGAHKVARAATACVDPRQRLLCQHYPPGNSAGNLRGQSAGMCSQRPWKLLLRHATNPDLDAGLGNQAMCL